jgi:hypothetical protein
MQHIVKFGVLGVPKLIADYTAGRSFTEWWQKYGGISSLGWPI